MISDHKGDQEEQDEAADGNPKEELAHYFEECKLG